MSQAQDRYHEYLESNYWKQVSLLVKKRADFRCQLCNSPHGLQAHHRSYQNRGRELEGNNINDLICLCGACHRLFHAANQAASEYPGVARAAEARRLDTEMEIVTKQNWRAIKAHKRAWHWMKDNGFDPRKNGWKRRAIGSKIPAFCFQPAQ